MIKPLVAVLMLSAAPLTAFAATPMSMSEDGNRLADNAPVVAADPASLSASDAADAPVDELREPMSAQGTPALRSAAMRPDTARAPAVHAPAPARNAAISAHKNHGGTRWQSLLPGVMK
jgi:hypothetical protein